MKRRPSWVLASVAVAALLIAATGVSSAQSNADLKLLLKELGAIKQTQQAMQKELAALRALIQARPAPAQAAPAQAPAVGRIINVANAPFKRRADAPLTMVEFSDFQCPFCARHFTQTLPQMTKEYIDTGKLKYVFKHFPLESIHPLAFKASEASECANDQGKFWPMHDRLFANQKLLAPLNLPVHAAGVGLDASTFNECLASGRHAAKARRDLADGKALGVTGTPAFVLGRTIPGSTTVRVEIYTSGAKAYLAFKQDLNRLLAQPAAR
jgi:protein-disulfide isomerase